MATSRWRSPTLSYDTSVENTENEKAGYIKALTGKLQPFENLLKKWGDEFITSKISFADYNLLDLMEIHQIIAPGCLESLPTLQAFVKKMQSRPGINKYQQTDVFKNMKINKKIENRLYI